MVSRRSGSCPGRFVRAARGDRHRREGEARHQRSQRRSIPPNGGARAQGGIAQDSDPPGSVKVQGGGGATSTRFGASDGAVIGSDPVRVRDDIGQALGAPSDHIGQALEGALERNWTGTEPRDHQIGQALRAVAASWTGMVGAEADRLDEAERRFWGRERLRVLVGGDAAGRPSNGRPSSTSYGT
jgi:hypothetical protein